MRPRGVPRGNHAEVVGQRSRSTAKARFNGPRGVPRGNPAVGGASSTAFNEAGAYPAETCYLGFGNHRSARALQ